MHSSAGFPDTSQGIAEDCARARFTRGFNIPGLCQISSVSEPPADFVSILEVRNVDDFLDMKLSSTCTARGAIAEIGTSNHIVAFRYTKLGVIQDSGAPSLDACGREAPTSCYAIESMSERSR